MERGLEMQSSDYNLQGIDPPEAPVEHLSDSDTRNSLDENWYEW